MTNEQPLKIVILPEEVSPTLPVMEESPLVPEHPGTQVKQVAAETGKQVVGAAKKVWDTDARRKVTGQIAHGAATVAAKSTKLVQDKVVETAERQAREQVTAVRSRIQETDWKAEAQTGTAKALRWLSTQLSNFAARLTLAKEPVDDRSSTTQENTPQV